MSNPNLNPDQTSGYETRSTRQKHFIRYAQYNTWFNKQLFDCLARLDEDALQRDRGAFFGSIHASLDHLLLCDRMWLSRIQRSPLPFESLEGAELVETHQGLDQVMTPDFASQRAAREETDAVLEAFVVELTPALLERNLEYTNSKGMEFCQPLWHIVGHIFNHQTHHRGQVTTLLSQMGIDPGMTDFIVAAILPSPEIA